MPNPLIRTKLRMPFTRPELVPRSRLQDQIALGLRGPLTLVTAPAGFGKTTLVASCLAGRGVRAAWLSLDSDDNQPGRFLTYLIAAVQAADPRVGEEAARLIAGIQPTQPEAILTSLINDLDGLDSELVLVLDDYQLITSPAAHAQVTFLLEHRPAALHLVIATRSDPPLPLARLRARGQVIELRAADLRFTAGETAQFLTEVMGLRLDSGAVAVLEERTEGWIAGLQMAALSMRDRKDIPGFILGFSGTNRYILDYLVEEVLACQPPEIQDFLLKTSILERMNAGLCDTVFVDPSIQDSGKNEISSSPNPASTNNKLPLPSASILDHLDRQNLFLVSLDDGWYRYHHLFADLLKVRLRQAHAGLIPSLHVRASEWLERNGFISEAIQHLFAANKMEQAADLIEHYGPAHCAESDPSIVMLADSLPPEMLLTRPKIGIYRSWLLILQGHIPRALGLLNELKRRPSTADSDPGQQWMQMMAGLALAFLGQRRDNPGFDPLPGAEILDGIPPGEPILRDTANILYGMTLARRGEVDRAAEFSVRCLQRESVPRRLLSPQPLTIPTLVAFLARLFLIQGRLHDAASLCREYLGPMKEKGIRFLYNAGSLNGVLGEVLYEWNRPEEAEQQIREGIRANEPWMDIMTNAFDLIALARVLMGKGDYTGAMQVVEKFENHMRIDHRPHEFEEDLYTLRARVQLACGDLQSASAWADELPRSEDFQRHPERYRLTLAAIRLAQGRYTEVEAVLAGEPGDPEDDNRITRQLGTNLLLAAALAGQGRMPEALNNIASSLTLAEPEGYIRVFIEAGQPARDLLAAYLRTAAPDHERFAQNVLAAFPASGAGSPVPQPAGLVEPAALIEPLTEREIEVLQLMAQGRTNEEIARQLVVARGTIKAHAASIYRKLDASNRTEAVAKARELGIL